MKALPTTAASAQGAMARMCPGFESPKPMASGKLVTRLVRSMIAKACRETLSRSPVTPALETR